MSFKDRLKEARLSKGFTQSELGALLGVASSTITGYEKGTSEPNMQKIQQIMKVLSVDANYLWQDEMNQIEAKIEKSPTATEIAVGEEKTIFEFLIHSFEAMGWVKENEDLSDEDLLFLTGIVSLIRAYYAKKK